MIVMTEKCTSNITQNDAVNQYFVPTARMSWSRKPEESAEELQQQHINELTKKDLQIEELTEQLQALMKDPQYQSLELRFAQQQTRVDQLRNEVTKLKQANQQLQQANRDLSGRLADFEQPPELPITYPIRNQDKH
jgi:predicted  nucleic acid-binding Zn-ribbon protein